MYKWKYEFRVGDAVIVREPVEVMRRYKQVKPILGYIAAYEPECTHIDYDLFGHMSFDPHFGIVAYDEDGALAYREAVTFENIFLAEMDAEWGRRPQILTPDYSRLASRDMDFLKKSWDDRELKPGDRVIINLASRKTGVGAYPYPDKIGDLSSGQWDLLFDRYAAENSKKTNGCCEAPATIIAEFRGQQLADPNKRAVTVFNVEMNDGFPFHAVIPLDSRAQWGWKNSCVQKMERIIRLDCRRIRQNLSPG